MCGIAGLFSVDRPADFGLVEAVLRMLDAQVHRGPDDWGILIPSYLAAQAEVQSLLKRRSLDHVRTYDALPDAPAAVLGSRRLAVLDTSERGRMPMSAHGDRVWLTYNGEVYNFHEIREAARRDGRTFVSNTDSEAIVERYAAAGEAVVEALRGMFAFAALDVRNPRDPKLFLARDRFGIKPLYWTRSRGVFQFASEVRAIVAGGLTETDAEPRALHGFLIQGSVPTPWTTIRGIYSLPAAHTLEVDKRAYSFPTPRRYWSIPRNLSTDLDAASAAREVRSLLQEAVSENLVSDVPLGIFLSGGMDSAAITALAASHRKLTTISVDFDEAEYSEGQHARSIAQRFGTKHVEVRVRAGDFLEELPRIIDAMDQPSVDGINTYFIAKAAREAGLTVVLSGLGGDEVFWGYPAIARLKPVSVLHRVPAFRWLARPVARAAVCLGFDRWEKLEFLSHDSRFAAYLAFRGLFPPARAARLLDAEELPLSAQAEPGPIGPEEYAALDAATYLQNQLLRDTDVFSMAHGIEVRVPLLDHRLFETVARVPPALKLPRHGNKPLLRAALGDLLDSQTASRRKMGFTFPLDCWLKLLPNSQSGRCEPVINREETAQVRRRFNAGKTHWSRIWAIEVANRIADRPVTPRLAARGPRRFLVLLSDAFATKGGIQSYNRGLLRALAAEFPRASIRVLSLNDTVLPEDPHLSGRIAFAGCGPRGSRLRKVRMLVLAGAKILAQRPDTVVCGHLHLAPVAQAARFLGAPPFHLVVHGVESWDPRPTLLAFAACATRVLSVSRYTADRLVARGLSEELITVVPNAVDGDVFRRVVDIPGAHTIFTLARLDRADRRKGVDRVIEALPKLRREFPDIRYVVAGTGTDIPRLELLASQLGVQASVEFVGAIADQDVPRRFSEAELFVMPSQQEGFGIVFIEALACGVPVVACGSEGSREALLGGRLGRLIDGQTGELDGALASVLREGLSASKRERIRADVLDAFGFDVFQSRIGQSFLPPN